MDGNAVYFSQYLNAYTPYKKTWNYEDSCVLVVLGNCKVLEKLEKMEK